VVVMRVHTAVALILFVLVMAFATNALLLVATRNVAHEMREAK
jgi:hypothetical protein